MAWKTLMGEMFLRASSHHGVRQKESITVAPSFKMFFLHSLGLCSGVTAVMVLKQGTKKYKQGIHALPIQKAQSTLGLGTKRLEGLLAFFGMTV